MSQPPQERAVAASVRDAVLEHATRTKHAVHDSSSFLVELQVQQAQYACLHWLCHFGILRKIPLAPSSIAYRDLARDAGVPLTTLRSVTRMLMTMGLLRETPEGALAHNAVSAPFVQDASLEVWLFHMVNHTVPLFRAMVGATERYGETAKVDETAYNVAAGTDLSFFQHLRSQPDLEHEFDKYMKSQAQVNTGVRVEHLLEGFPWAALPEGALVVDVGGGSGTASVAVATAHPTFRLVVQDQAVPIENAKKAHAELQAAVARRIRLEEHDFFGPQPVVDADVYLLRTIIHDWPDAESVQILQQLARVLKPGARILIMDMVIPVPDSGSRTLEAALRQKDLAMMLTFNAKEREADDWYALITKVDPPLSIQAIRRPEGCQHSVMEISRASEQKR